MIERNKRVEERFYYEYLFTCHISFNRIILAKKHFKASCKDKKSNIISTLGFFT